MGISDSVGETLNKWGRMQARLHAHGGGIPPLPLTGLTRGASSFRREGGAHEVERRTGCRRALSRTHCTAASWGRHHHLRCRHRNSWASACQGATRYRLPSGGWAGGFQIIACGRSSCAEATSTPKRWALTRCQTQNRRSVRQAVGMGHPNTCGLCWVAAEAPEINNARKGADQPTLCGLEHRLSVRKQDLEMGDSAARPQPQGP